MTATTTTHQPPAQLPEVLTVDHMAALLGCEPGRVEEAVRRRELPFVRYGRTAVFPRDAVITQLNRQALAALEGRAQDGSQTPQRTVRQRPALQAVPAPKPPNKRPRGQSPAPLGDPPAALVEK